MLPASCGARSRRRSLPDEARREAERELDRLGSIPDGVARARPDPHATSTGWPACPGRSSSGGEIDVARARAGARRGPLRPREGQGPHPRVPRGEEAAPGARVGGCRAPVTAPAREPILCFVGPPGVGKTSLGQSIARALGRKFVRMSLGGVRDEAEIRGHRRTYIGALPGPHHPGRCGAPRRATRSSCSTRSTRSAPTGAAIRRRRCSRCSTPRRTTAFVDTYLGVPFDLSQVLFIATANTLDTIPARCATAWRCCSSRATPTRRSSASRASYLVPKQLAAHGLTPDELSFDPTRRSASIVRDYTREAGVRNLEREIATVDPQGRRATGRRPAGRPVRGHRRKPSRLPRAAALLRRGGGAHGRARGSRPDSRGRRPAATCSSSRRR